MRKLKVISTVTSLLVSTMFFSNVSAMADLGVSTGNFVEDVSLRSEYSKFFREGNRNVTELHYSVPLHFNNNGKWVDIDNTLVLDEFGNYTNACSDFNISLSSKIQSDSNVLNVEYNGYSIDMSMIDTNDSMRDSELSLINEQNVRQLDMGSDVLDKLAASSISNISSSAVYEEVYENVDIRYDIVSESLKESIIIKNKDNIPEDYKFFIETGELTANLTENNTIIFTNDDGKDVLCIPTPFMVDSSGYNECVEKIEVNLDKAESGYYLTYIPDKEWLMSEDVVYPVTIDPSIRTIDQSAFTFSYNSEAYPTQRFSPDANSVIRVGNKSGNHFQGYMTFNSYNITLGTYAVVNDAKLHITAYSGNVNTSMNLHYNTHNVSTQSAMCWNNDNSVSANTKICSSSDSFLNMNPGVERTFDISSLVQSWYNYIYAYTSDIGAAEYGVKFVAVPNTNSTLYLYTGTNSFITPYMVINYTVGDSYYLPYSPYKYNDGPANITNFQKRMNCYAYALQVYYNGSNNYKLLPGEFGISEGSSSRYPTSVYSDLMNSNGRDGYYNVFLNNIKNASTDVERATISKEYMDFIEEQMLKDASEFALSFDITPLQSYSSDNRVVDNDFVLPDDFNPDRERIIAFVTYYKRIWNSITREYMYAFDYHYYLRNGNGTCIESGNDTCSIWTHKPGMENVKNTCASDNSIVLCDENIGDYACSIPGITYTNNEVRYYRITKRNNLYNSWHGNGHFDDSTGTSYREF